MMAKDSRYKTVNVFIERGEVKKLADIFNYIPRKVVYIDLGINYNRFKRLLEHPDQFTLQELSRLAFLIEVGKQVIINLLYAQIDQNSKVKKRGVSNI